jgi:hypothetical protein
MFKERTLFVLGAGASFEVGIPVGTGLARMIADLLTTELYRQAASDFFRSLYNRFPQQSRTFDHAAVAIRDGVRLTNSIDDYLDRRSGNEAIQHVGKAAIVKSILFAERQCRFIYGHGRSPNFGIDLAEDTWFVKFFRMLGAEVHISKVAQIFDNVTFVVFNYDRCVEFFLINALQLVYGIGLNESRTIVAKCRIIHPYGTIASLGVDSSSVPFGGVDGFEHDYAALSDGLRTYTEEMADKETVGQIYEEITLAKQIVFLGFGYNTPNMELLRPPQKISLKPVFGTALGMSPPSIEVVQHQLARMFNGGLSGILPAMQLADMTCTDLFNFHARRLPN